MKKWALITGASGGIGRAIAQTLASTGYSLYLHYNQNKQAVLEIQEQLIGVETKAICADLSCSEGVHSLLEQITHDIDVIIHNCGNSYVGLVTDMTDSEVEMMIQLHVTSPFQLTRKLLPPMISKKGGNVVMITSIWGLTGASCEVLYSMVKGAQNTYVKALAKEVALSGVRVNAIAPGAINTEMLKSFSEDDLREIAEEIPVGSIGQPKDVANAVQFLISEKSSYITGQVLSVNGGWYT